MQHVVSGADAVSGANVASPPPPPPKPADKPAPAVEAFQELIDGPLTKYVDLSKEIGGLVAEQVRDQPFRRHALHHTLRADTTAVPYRRSKSRMASSPKRTLSASHRRAPSCRPRRQSTRT